MGLFNTLAFIIQHPLSRDRRLKNLARFGAWQVGARLVPGSVAVEFVNKSELLVCAGMTGATQNVYVGLQEFEDMAFVLHFLRKGELFADIGANVGSYTILAATTGAHVVAFEPGPATFRWLIKNITFNGRVDVVELHNIALGAQSGTVKFIADMDTLNHVIVGVNEKNDSFLIDVSMATLDEVLRGRCPALIKLDVEGFETEVLRGAEITLTNPDLRCVIIELNGNGARYGYDENVIRDKMRNIGFEVFSYAPFERDLRQGIASGCSGNTLFVRDVEFVKKRLREGPTFSINDWVI
jgi:FkbM family methyltransferase